MGILNYTTQEFVIFLLKPILPTVTLHLVKKNMNVKYLPLSCEAISNIKDNHLKYIEIKIFAMIIYIHMHIYITYTHTYIHTCVCATHTTTFHSSSVASTTTFHLLYC